MPVETEGEDEVRLMKIPGGKYAVGSFKTPNIYLRSDQVNSV